jgi:hypothetical protein
MAQFIQGGSLPQVQGTAGDVRVVQDKTPTAGDLVSNLTNLAGKTFDSYGDIYAQDKAKSLVEEEIENIDSAVAAAESGEFSQGDDVPESIKLDQKEWIVLQNAVKNGEMTQTKATMLASSRLRSRISQEPMFADKLRKAASGVVGFNIESEYAKRYFGAFPTEAQVAGSEKNKYFQEKDQQAAVFSSELGGSKEMWRRELVQQDADEMQLKIFDTQLELGNITASKWASEHAAKDGRNAFEKVMTNLQLMSKSGEPIDNVVVNNNLLAQKEIYLTELRNRFSANNGDINGEEFARAEKAADERYDGYADLVEAFGTDNLMKVKIDRLKNARDLYGAEFYGNVLLAKDIFGEKGMNNWFQLVSRDINETQRQKMFKEFPQLQEIDSLMRGDAQDLQKHLGLVTQKLTTGGDLSEENEGAVDAAASSSYKDGNETAQNSIIETLDQNAMPFKAASLIATKRPGITSVNNISAMKKYYERKMPQAISDLGRLVDESVNLSTYTRSDGKIGIKLGQGGYEGIGRVASRSDDLDRLAEANGILDKIDVFYNAIDKGWADQLGTDKESLGIRLTREIEQNVSRRVGQRNVAQFAKQQATFKSQVVEGNEEGARETFNKLRQSNPNVFTSDFDTIYAEIRRRRLEAEDARSR